MRSYHKSTYIKDLRRKLNKAEKVLVSETFTVDVKVSENDVYIIDIGVDDEPISDFKVLVTSPNSKSFVISYGFVKGQDMILTNTPSKEGESKKLRLMSTSSTKIKTIYVYFEYGVDKEYLSIPVGE